ncbi:hypothetical protein BDW66DRAFT_155271 [Aspergillus desertorum]
MSVVSSKWAMQYDHGGLELLMEQEEGRRRSVYILSCVLESPRQPRVPSLELAVQGGYAQVPEPTLVGISAGAMVGDAGLAVELLHGPHPRSHWHVLYRFLYHPPRYAQLNVDGKTKWQMIMELDFVGIVLFVPGCVIFLIGLSWEGIIHP